MDTLPPPSANGSKGWIAALMNIAREGGPATLVLMVVLGGVSLWFLHGELRWQRERTKEVVQLLLEEKDKRVELALRVGECSKTSYPTETKVEGLPYLSSPN